MPLSVFGPSAYTDTRMIRRFLPILVLVLFLLPAAGVRADSESEPNLTIISARAWCTTAGSCSDLLGTANYHYAEVDAYTQDTPWAGKRRGQPQELYATCDHAYTVHGVRRFDREWVQAQYFAAGSPSVGRISGWAAVTSRDVSHQATRASSAIHATLTRSGRFIEGAARYHATNRATITGSQVTNNNRQQLVSGGFLIRISGTIRHYHRVGRGSDARWYFDRTTRGWTQCRTVHPPHAVKTVTSIGQGTYVIPP